MVRQIVDILRNDAIMLVTNTTRINIMEFLQSILQVYAFISVAFTTFFLIHVVRSIRKDLAKENAEENPAKDILESVYLEKVGDISYLYDSATNKFIAQGNTNTELWANVAAMFPDKEFLVKTPDGQLNVVQVKYLK